MIIIHNNCYVFYENIWMLTQWNIINYIQNVCVCKLAKIATCEILSLAISTTGTTRLFSKWTQCNG